MPQVRLTNEWKARVAAGVSLVVLVPVGFYSKVGYKGPASDWVNNSLGGFFYEMFWCLVAFGVWPRWSARAIAVWVCAVTCFLEFTQMFHPPWMEELRSHFLIRTIIGSTFDWFDFPYYFVGSAAGYLWLRRLPGARR